MKLNGAQIVLESLVEEGVDVVWGVPGGSTLALYNLLPDYPAIRHILVRHEQAAAMAADGYARITGRPGVCLATSGPGATNLITGIADAMMDSVPLVAITGQVARPFIGKDAFQETDIVGISLPIVKYNYQVMDIDDLDRIMHEAFYLARTGRPGPVLIDIPRDLFVLETDHTGDRTVQLRGYRPTRRGHIRQIRQAAALIDTAEKPLIIAGRGVEISEAYPELKELAEKANIPVLTTLLGIGCFPESHPLSFGMPGMHGMYYANMATCHTDLLIAIGMRFDDRVTARVSSFAPNAKVIHIDIDPAEIGKNVAVTVPIVGDCKLVLSELNKLVGTANHPEWIGTLNTWRTEHPALDIDATDDVLPQYVVREIYHATRGEAIISSDVGQNQMWSAQHYWYDHPRSWLSSGGLGSMGFGVPAAMGAQLARPDREVWAIVGDGGFQMNIQELVTLVENRIPVKIAILNNCRLGMIRQWQDMFYRGNYSACQLGGVEFAKVAEAYGMPGFKVERKEDVRATIERAREIEGPVLIDFRIQQGENVYPMVAPGTSNWDVIEKPPVRDGEPVEA